MLAINTDSPGSQSPAPTVPSSTPQVFGAVSRKPTADEVGAIIRGISVIGMACEALRQAGWLASIAANRITVNDAVMADLVGARNTWVICTLTDDCSICVVDAGRANGIGGERA